jgi:hypothetical protein
MARFYASIQGSRGEVTRCGTPTSGIRGHIRGRNVGCRVIVRTSALDGKDHVSFYRTGGSGGAENLQLIATYTEGEPTEFHKEAAHRGTAAHVALRRILKD